MHIVDSHVLLHHSHDAHIIKYVMVICVSDALCVHVLFSLK